MRRTRWWRLVLGVLVFIGRAVIATFETPARVGFRMMWSYWKWRTESSLQFSRDLKRETRKPKE